MSPPVFLGAAGLILAFVVYGALFTAHAAATFSLVQDAIIGYFGWFYILSASAILVFVVWLGVGRTGNIRLGGDHAQPEFHSLTWFTMLMAAGMGIGLVFFGVAEPIEHYLAPPVSQTRTPEAIREAMLLTFFHWGLHPWAIYIAIALPLAYFHFRHELPLAPRSLLYPLIGDRMYGWPGHLVDILCTVGTLFGVGTSLGLGAMQINSALGLIAGVPGSLLVQLLIIAVITTIATISVVTGLKIGIRRLSQLNVALAVVLLAFVFVAGPTVYILETFVSGIGQYLQNLPRISFNVDTTANGGWQRDWTLFYWSWWIAWCPFVGVFAARISRGRTVRQFILAMLLAPTLGGFFWFSVMGGSALYIEQFGAGGIAGPSLEDEAFSLFALLQQLPMTWLMSVLGMLVVVIFFITSSDSGSLVDVMVTSGGHRHPPVAYRIFWCVAEGVVAATLLAAGGLVALRTASLTPALPMTVFLLVGCYGLARALRVDAQTEGRPDVEDLVE